MNLYKALYAYRSDESCDLYFEINDVIECLSQDSSSWYRGRNLMTDKSGLFPFNFVTQIHLPKIDNKIFVVKKCFNECSKGDIIVAKEVKMSEIIGFVATDNEENIFNIPIQFLTQVQQKSVKSKFIKCIAITDSQEETSHLSFLKGDIIWMTKELDGNLGEGIMNEKKGIFSLFKVELCKEEDGQSIDRKNRWVALYDYSSDNKNDLKFAQNEKLKFLDRVDINWFLMQNQDGEIGMAPCNFVKNISVSCFPRKIKSEDNVDVLRGGTQINIPLKQIINELKNHKAKIQANTGVKRDSETQDKVHETDFELSSIYDNSEVDNYTCLEPSSTNIDQEEKSESLSIQLEQKEKKIENDLEVLRNDIVSIKNKLSRQDADLESIESMTNNLAFLKEEYQEKQKQLSSLKQQKENLLNGNIMYNDVTDDIEAIEKKYITKTKVIDEILETELKFINDMKLTLKSYNLAEMRSKITEQDYNCIFADLNAIILISKNFYSDLSNGVDNCGVEVHIGSIFLTFLDSFERVYKEYCINYDRKLELINKKSRHQEMEEFLNEGLSRMAGSGTIIVCIDSMLVKPLQRFLKYPLFMKTIIENTNEGHEDMSDLRSALLQFEIIAKKINEKKRFEELRTEIFEHNGVWHQKTLHAIQKVPKRFIVASLYGSQQDDDLEYHGAITRFKNLKKCISFFIETVIILRDNLKDVLTTYSVLNEDLNQMMSSTFGSQFHQYIIICKTAESNYYKKYTATLESLVLNPLNKLVELFSGPKLLIKKRKSKFLDYLGMKQKIDRELTKVHPERLDILNNQYLAINNTLKEELPILTSKSKEIFNECLANYLQLTTSTLQASINGLQTLKGDQMSEEEQKVCKNSQFDILSHLQRSLLTYNSRNTVYKIESLTKSLVMRSDSLSRSDFYYQTDEDVMNLKIKFETKDMAFVKKDFFPTKSHQIYILKNNIVGIIKRCDPQGHGNSWLVEVSLKRIGFVPRSYLNPVPLTKERQYSVVSSFTMRRTTLANKEKRYSLFDTSSNIDLMQFSPNSPKRTSLFLDDPFEEMRVALFDFKSSGQTDISMMKNDQLSVIEVHDKTGNTSWSLVKNLRTGAQGYVPTNYMSSKS